MTSNSMDYNGIMMDFEELARNESIPWENVGDVDGVAVSTISPQKIPNYKGKSKEFNITKSITVINSSPKNIIDIIADGNRRSEYDELFDGKESVEVIQDNGPGNRITVTHNKLKPPATLVSARDFCVLTVSRFDPETGKGLFVSNSIEHPNCPPNKNYTRAHLTNTGYLLEPANEQKTATKIIYLTQMDPKGWLPTSVMNKTAKKQGQSLVKLAKYISSLPTTQS